jgi:hypothetical protein
MDPVPPPRGEFGHATILSASARQLREQSKHRAHLPLTERLHSPPISLPRQLRNVLISQSEGVSGADYPPSVSGADLGDDVVG